MWYETLLAAHLAVTDQVSHGARMHAERYFVWQEDGINALLADGRHSERAITGSTDLYTKREFDPWKEGLETALTEAGIAWMLNSVQYEEETGFWHYEWYWEALDDGQGEDTRL